MTVATPNWSQNHGSVSLTEPDSFVWESGSTRLWLSHYGLTSFPLTWDIGTLGGLATVNFFFELETTG